MFEILQSRYTTVAPEADRRLPVDSHSVCAERLLYLSRCSVLWQWKLKKLHHLQRSFKSTYLFYVDE